MNSLLRSIPSLLSVVAFLATTATAQDIPTIAGNDGRFQTLVAALSETDLVGALSEPSGPYTVFAPTDDAFAKLPEGLVTCLLEAENLPLLSDILLYHVAPTQALSTDLSDGMSVSTLLEQDVSVSITGGKVFINGVEVVIPDIIASNGVIHVVDEVLVPPGVDVAGFLAGCTAEELPDIPGTAIAAGLFGTLVTALGEADLVGALSAPNGPFTVFAPTDDAFASLPDGVLDCLLEPSNSGVLSDVLLYHVAPGAVPSTDLTDGQEVSTLLAGAEVTVDLSSGVKINQATVTIPDFAASNGIIHVIDQVLVPGSLDINALCFPPAPEPVVVESHGPDCEYLGVGRSAGQYLTGPTHTCLCTSSGAWTRCRPNHGDVKTIKDIAIESNQLTTLEAAIRKADIVGVLDGPGPYTVFAPTDRAFANVPTKLLDFLLADGNEETLAKVLKYHVYSGSIESSAIPTGSVSVPTLLEGTDEIAVEKSCISGVDTCSGTYSILLNDSSYVVQADVEASNGIIHAIEEVLIPPSLVAAVEGILAA